jgi:hypothetical protein
VQEVECSVNAGDADGVAAAAKRVRDLEGGEAAILVREQLDHGLPRATRPVAGPLEIFAGAVGP